MNFKFFRARRFLLKPTAQQAETFTQFAGVARLVYNLALEQRSTFWRQYKTATGKHISVASQCREVTALRAEFDFVRAVHSDVPTAALRDLDKAFTGFFRGVASYPNYRSRYRDVSFRLRGGFASVRRLNGKWSELRLPGIGWVKYRDTRSIGERIVSITVSLRQGMWFASVACEVQAKDRAPAQAVGIDRGVANTIALSTGAMLSLPTEFDLLARSRKQAQKVLSRRRRGSARYARQKAKMAAIVHKTTARRTDWIHRQTKAIASSFNHVALEKLNITGMTASAAGTVAEPGKGVAQKRGLNRAILHQGWGIFARQLEYKVEERGGLLVYVNPAYSSQTCSACGAVDAKNRKSQAVFRCVACGHEGHADVEAAKEILRRSTAPEDVEGSRRRPAEASTMRDIA